MLKSLIVLEWGEQILKGWLFTRSGRADVLLVGRHGLLWRSASCLILVEINCYSWEVKSCCANIPNLNRSHLVLRRGIIRHSGWLLCLFLSCRADTNLRLKFRDIKRHFLLRFKIRGFPRVTLSFFSICPLLSLHSLQFFFHSFVLQTTRQTWRNYNIWLRHQLSHWFLFRLNWSCCPLTKYLRGFTLLVRILLSLLLLLVNFLFLFGLLYRLLLSQSGVLFRCQILLMLIDEKFTWIFMWALRFPFSAKGLPQTKHW